MHLGTLGIVLSVAALAACAAEKPAALPRESPPPARSATERVPPSGTIGEETRTATATVERVDLKTRHVTLKRPAVETGCVGVL